MPRGRLRKVDPEILSSEEEQPKGRKKLVEAEHTIKYTSPVPVTVEETEDAELELFDEDLEERRKRKPKNEREELRKKLMTGGVTPASSLKLLVQKYVHSDAADSGTLADKSYCTKYPCTEAHITTQDYMEIVSSKWGAGRYWFTLYMNNKIVTQWEESLAAKAQPITSVVQHAIPGDPTSPQVIVQMPQGDGQHQAVVFDPVKAMKEQTLAFKQQLENYKLMRDVFGPVVEPGQQANPTADPDANFVQTLLTDNTKLKEKLSNGLIGQILGSKAVDDDPSWGSVLMKGIEKGEVSKAIDSIGRIAVTLLDMILPKRGDNNGQAQMGAPPLAHQTQNEAGQIQSTDDRNQGSMGQTQINEAPSQVLPPGDAQSATTPEDQALQLVIEHCQKNLPVQIAFTRLMAYADAVNDQAPQYSIDGYLDLFATMPIDGALEFVKTQPNGDTVVSLDHAKMWTEALQKLIQESQEGGE